MQRKTLVQSIVVVGRMVLKLGTIFGPDPSQRLINVVMVSDAGPVRFSAFFGTPEYNLLDKLPQNSMLEIRCTGFKRQERAASSEEGSAETTSSGAGLSSAGVQTLELSNAQITGYDFDATAIQLPEEIGNLESSTRFNESRKMKDASAANVSVPGLAAAAAAGPLPSTK